MKTNSDLIADAERLLLQPGEVFDEERRCFILNLDTIDLKAVPGSGKTTALLAKLIVLDKRLPLGGGRGVLVISHTNAAVDEIRSKLEHHCPMLFQYPNFVGTIQEFVDSFLALPYYCSKLKRGPQAIDDRAYYEAMSRTAKLNLEGFVADELKRVKYFLKVHREKFLYSYRLRLEDGKSVVCSSASGAPVNIKKPERKTKKGSKSQTTYVDWTDFEKARVCEWLIKLKFKVLTEYGVLHYDDAYYLGQRFLSEYPAIADSLRNRFKYVFVDEMQDMQKHQHDLLEELFLHSEVCYQRIGDSNQAIYGGGTEDEVVWSKRDASCTLALTGSHRLTPAVASIVQQFATDASFKLNGLRADTSNPVLLVFHDSRVKDVIPRFVELVREKIQEPEQLSNPIMAVGWVKSVEGIGRFGLEDYHPGWKEPLRVGKKSPNFDTAHEYLFAAHCAVQKGGALGQAYMHCLRAFCKALTLDEIAPHVAKYWSTSLLDRLMRNSSSCSDTWVIDFHEICMSLATGDLAEAHGLAKSLYELILAEVGASQTQASIAFFAQAGVDASGSAKAEEESRSNQHIDEATGITIDIGTVHSAKGQTHSATLFLETYYKAYESTRLKNSFLGKGKYPKPIHRAAARVAYVAMSRPTHLLGLAMREEHFSAFGNKLPGWEIVRLEQKMALASAETANALAPPPR